MGEKDGYYLADRVKCPVCDHVFEDEKAGEKMPDTQVEDQAHFKALDHFAEEHEDWLEENNGFPGLIPVENKVENQGSEPKKLKDVI